MLSIAFGQSRKNTLNLSPKAKEKRLVLKTSFSLCFRTGTSALPTARWRAISKMLFKLRKNTMPRRNAPRLPTLIFRNVILGGEGGIRTRELFTAQTFQVCGMNHYPTSPGFTILPILGLLIKRLVGRRLFLTIFARIHRPTCPKPQQMKTIHGPKLLHDQCTAYHFHLNIPLKRKLLF